MENLNNSPIWSLPFSSFLTISTNSGGKYSNSAAVFIFFFYLHWTFKHKLFFEFYYQSLSVWNYSDKNWNTLTPKFSVLTGFCSLSAPFIYIGYNLFTNSTSGNRKNAKLLKDKQFELRKVTGAVVAYSSSLFCTQRLIGWIWKCWNLLFQFCPVIGLHCLGGPGFSSRSVMLLH